MAKNTSKSWPFKTENNSQTLPKQLWKSPEYDFFDPQNCQKWALKTAKGGQIFDPKSNFSRSFNKLSTWKYKLSTWKYTQKRANLGRKQAQAFPKHLLNNFEQVQKTTFRPTELSILPNKMFKVGKFLNENLEILGHLSTFRA